MTDTPEAAPAQLSLPDSALFEERSHLLALAALHYPSYIAHSDKAHPEAWVLTLDTPHGQLSWYLVGTELDLFPHVRVETDDELAQDANDGHTPQDQRDRVTRHIASYPAMVKP